MKQLLIFSFLVLFGCKENVSSEGIQDLNTSVENSKENENQEYNWSGKWIYVKKEVYAEVPEQQFTLTIKQDGNDVFAQYCAIAASGRKIDCEAEIEFNFTGKIKDEKIVGTFYSFFGSKSDLGRAEISFINDNTIQWKVINEPKEEFYAPEICRLTRLKNTSIHPTKNTLNFPLTSKNANKLEWIESDKYQNFNLLYELPTKQPYSIILAKNDLGDDEVTALLIISQQGKIVDKLQIGFVEDGYPDSDRRLITEFSISNNYEVTLTEFERVDYDQTLKSKVKYTLSDDGKFVKSK